MKSESKKADPPTPLTAAHWLTLVAVDVLVALTGFLPAGERPRIRVAAIGLGVILMIAWCVQARASGKRFLLRGRVFSLLLVVVQHFYSVLLLCLAVVTMREMGRSDGADSPMAWVVIAVPFVVVTVAEIAALRKGGEDGSLAKEINEISPGYSVVCIVLMIVVGATWNKGVLQGSVESIAQLVLVAQPLTVAVFALNHAARWADGKVLDIRTTAGAARKTDV